MRMRSFGIVAVLIVAACAKPDPQPASSVEERQPVPSPEQPQQPVRVELPTAAATPSDDTLTRLKACKLPEDLDRRIGETQEALDQLRVRYGPAYPDVVRVRRDLDALVQMGLTQCVERAQVDSPGHI